MLQIELCAKFKCKLISSLSDSDRDEILLALSPLAPSQRSPSLPRFHAGRPLPPSPPPPPQTPVPTGPSRACPMPPSSFYYPPPLSLLLRISANIATKWLLNAGQKARQASAKHTPSTRQAYAKQRPFRAKHTRGHPILCGKTTKTAAKQRPQVPLV